MTSYIQGLQQRRAEDSPGNNDDGEPGVFRCPRCGSWCDFTKFYPWKGAKKATLAGLKCRTKDWIFIGGHYLPVPDNVELPEPCENPGHYLCWQWRQIGRAVFYECRAGYLVDGTLEVCGRKARTGELQGFLAPGAPTTPALATKDLLLCGLHFLGEYGGYRQELAEASGLSLPVLDGALKRNTKGRWPHVKRSPHREPLPVQGSAYRYWLSIRGQMYIRQRFPGLLSDQSTNGVHLEAVFDAESWPEAD